MKIGVTGTREGMNDSQRSQIISFLEKHKGSELHHGDCRGVDVQVAAIAKELGYKIVCHPPKLTEQQGHFGGDEIREPAGYLQRDRAIVDETEILLVVPLQNERQDKGGTWYTYDYALKTGKTVHMCYPG
jgi:hypothetical protein